MRAVVSSTIGYIAAAIFNSLLVLVKETNKGVTAWLATTFGHHWIGHGILTLIVFILTTLISWFIFTNKKYESTDKVINRLTILLIVFTILSVAIIAGFYGMEAAE